MKKILKILLINICLLIVVFILTDIFCFVKNLKYNGRTNILHSPILLAEEYAETYKRIFYSNKDYDVIFLKNKIKPQYRKAINLQSDKKPILIMGCSFAYGNDLSPQQSLMGKLAKYTQRPVYNRSIPGRGANEMLYQLRSRIFYKDIPKPEWFIYVFIDDQIRRTKVPCSVDDTAVFYDDNLNKIKNINFPLLYTIKNNLIRSYKLNEQNYIHYAKLMHEMKSEIQKHWGNDVKLVFLIYDNSSDKMLIKLKQMLEQDGFQTYFVSDLTKIDIMDNKYKMKDKIHPTEEAWELLTPAIIQKTGM